MASAGQARILLRSACRDLLAALQRRPRGLGFVRSRNMERYQLEALLQDMLSVRDVPEYEGLYRLVEAELEALRPRPAATTNESEYPIA
ncbi:MAG: hypothetical protein AMJ69_11440 [Gammaproteobacteria bacterium SG8_47]|nr:MAG: hypothetical protein AMJ69_11440 [Gammaproteobacteria bacterium SG8_47]